MNSAKQKKGRILIIEDSAAIQKLTKQVITFERDYDVAFAENGQVGLDIIERSAPFDVILIDIEMPIMTGDECIQAIRSLDDPTKAKVPVIVCTGNAKEYTPEDFEEMGFTESFVKPLDYTGLMQKIRPILEKVGN